MIKGIGIDICAVSEISSMLESCGDAALVTMFTQGEVERSQEYSEATRAEHLAGVFAAKEAVFKAFDIDWDTGVVLNEVEVEAHPSGQPHAVLKGRFAELFAEAGNASAGVPARLHLTISHDAGVAVAAAVLEGA